MNVGSSLVQLDNSDVRIVEWRLTPGASARSDRTSSDCLLVPLSSGQIRIVSAHRDASVTIAPGASVLLAAPLEHDFINESNMAVAFVEIELKHTAQRLISG